MPPRRRLEPLEFVPLSMLVAVYAAENAVEVETSAGPFIFEGSALDVGPGVKAGTRVTLLVKLDGTLAVRKHLGA